MKLRDHIHVDEKWFYLTHDGRQFILADDETKPYRHVKHKSHLTKVMFLCAVAHPRFVASTKQWWDGKLGIWPVGEWVPAKRSSVNRPCGSLVWKNTSITRDVYRSLLINKLIPAISDKWPESHRNTTIIIQQDGAKSHIPENDPEFNQALQAAGLDVKVITQAANSPDVNVCDLGFFRAIQSANDKIAMEEGELIKNVQDAYWSYSKEKLNFTWLTLQSVFNMIIKNHGGNNYNIPHMSKEKLA
jgi:hypothetical protein